MRVGSGYSAIELHTFSGTGNTLRIATAIAEQLKPCAPAGIVSIHHKARSVRGGATTSGGTRRRLLTGVLAPTHGFGPPWIVVRHVLWKMPRGRGGDAFAVATRGAARLGRVQVPGYEGAATLLLALLLRLRGYRLRAITAIDTPANWLTLHPGFTPDNAEAVFARAQTRVQELTAALVQRRRFFPPEALFCALLGALLLPLALVYMSAARVLLGQALYASSACTGCGICARSCPAGAIQMIGAERGRATDASRAEEGADRRPATPVPRWTLRCESCMRCVAYCPERAVESSYPYLAGLIVLSLAPLFFPALPPLLARATGLTVLANPLLAVVAWIPVALAAAWVGQWLLFALRSIPGVRTVLSITGVMHFFRRSHAPGVSLSQLQRGCRSHESTH